MDQEGKRHWIEFWLAANNFRTQWNAHNASDDALIIYNKYGTYLSKDWYEYFDSQVRYTPKSWIIVIKRTRNHMI